LRQRYLAVVETVKAHEQHQIECTVNWLKRPPCLRAISVPEDS
jgi:hypothetical protein